MLLLIALLSLLAGSFMAYISFSDMFFCKPGGCGVSAFLYLPAFIILGAPSFLINSTGKKLLASSTLTQTDRRDVKIIRNIAKVSLFIWLSPILAGLLGALLLESEMFASLRFRL